MLFVSVATLAVYAFVQYHSRNSRWRKVRRKKNELLYKINIRTLDNLDNYMEDLKNELWAMKEYRISSDSDEFKSISVLMDYPIALPEMYGLARNIGLKYGIKAYSCEDKNARYGLIGDGIEEGLGYH